MLMEENNEAIASCVHVQNIHVKDDDVASQSVK